MESSGNQAVTQVLFEKKKKTIYDVMEYLASSSQLKIIFVTQLVSLLLAVLSFLYIISIPDIKEYIDYNTYIITTIISKTLDFLCVFSIGLFIYQCSKRIYPKSSIIILETSLVLNLIYTFIFDIIDKEYLNVTIFSLTTRLAIYIIIFAELNTLISFYKNESLAMSSDTLKIFCIVLGIIVSLGALLSLPNVFVNVYYFLYFLLIVTSAVTYFSIASLLEKYNYITSRYMYNNELLHKEEKKIHIPPQDHWRCPRCNTKNSLDDEMCLGCNNPQSNTN